MAAPVGAFLVLALVIGCGGAGGGDAGAAGNSGTGSGGSNSGGSSTGGSSTGGSSTGTTTGGTTGGTAGGSTTGGTTGGPLQIAPSSTPPQYEVHFLSGVGRGINDYEVEVTGMELRGPAGSLISGFSPRWIVLDTYISTVLSMTGASTPTTRTYDQLLVQFNRLQEPGGTIFVGPVQKSMLSDARLSRGRTTVSQILLDPTMFEPEGNAMTMNHAAFDALNTDPYFGKLPSAYSDLIRFDVSGILSRPTLDAGGQASQVYVSGDFIGLSGPTGGGFEVILDLDRRFDTAPLRRGTASSGATNGTYTIQQSDPLGSAIPIPRIAGTWQNAEEVVLNMGSFVALALPSADPGVPDHFLMISRNESGAINEFWIGSVDVAGGFFTAFPLGELKLFRSTLLSGTISDNGTGGSFSVVSGTRPASFPSNGTYLRYLR
jgi:hypothetical protein